LPDPVDFDSRSICLPHLTDVVEDASLLPVKLIFSAIGITLAFTNHNVRCR